MKWFERVSAMLDILADKTGICVIRDRLIHPGSADVITLDIPGYRQVESYTCGFVAGLMVLHTFHPEARVDRFYKAVAPTRRWGASTRKVANALRRSGVGVSVRADLSFQKIAVAIDKGYPIITVIRTSDPDVHHWVVIYGYGKNPDRVFIAANGLPYFARREYPIGEYKKLALAKGFGLVCWGK